MNKPTSDVEQLREEMRRLRSHMDADVESFVENTRDLFNWHSYFQKCAVALSGGGCRHGLLAGPVEIEIGHRRPGKTDRVGQASAGHGDGAGGPRKGRPQLWARWFWICCGERPCPWRRSNSTRFLRRGSRLPAHLTAIHPKAASRGVGPPSGGRRGKMIMKNRLADDVPSAERAPDHGAKREFRTKHTNTRRPSSNTLSTIRSLRWQPPLRQESWSHGGSNDDERPDERTRRLTGTIPSSAAPATPPATWLTCCMTPSRWLNSNCDCFVLDCQQLKTKLGTSPDRDRGRHCAGTGLRSRRAGRSCALFFRDVAGLSRLGAVWLTFGLAFLVAAICIGCGIWWLRNATNVFESSRVELTQNIERLKEMLWRSSHPTESHRGAETRFLLKELSLRENRNSRAKQSHAKRNSKSPT